jgi:hypothetical protein
MEHKLLYWNWWIYSSWIANVESWNGTNWTEVSDLNTARAY